jgi:hypothetical protein
MEAISSLKPSGHYMYRPVVIMYRQFNIHVGTASCVRNNTCKSGKLPAYVLMLLWEANMGGQVTMWAYQWVENVFRGTWLEADCADLVTALSDELGTARWRSNDQFELRCMIQCRDIHSSPLWLPSPIPSQHFCCADLRSTWIIRTVVSAPVTQADTNAIRHTAGGDGIPQFLAPVSNQSLTVFQ